MSNSPKRPYKEVFPVAKRIVERLRPYCERIEVAGSLRRVRPMVGDIELVALPRAQKTLFGDTTGEKTQLDAFLAESEVAFSKNGPRYKQFAYGRYTVDLFLPASPAHWGWRFLQSTGSHEFNMWLVGPVKKAMGVRFSDGLLYDSYGALVETPEETDVLNALGLPWIPPQHRDDNRWLTYVPDGHPAGRVMA